ncbi:MAG: aryl-sulfate sulfotransferase [bacterium]
MKHFFYFLLSLFIVASCNNGAYLSGTSDSSVDVDSSDGKEERGNDDETTFFNLKVEQNEKNVLSCRLTFNTKEKKKMSVKYFSKDHKGYEITEENKTTDHYFFLWGMRAEEEYEIEIYEEDISSPVATADYTSGALPLKTPGTFLATNEKEKVADGFVLFKSAPATIDEPLLLATMVDTDGKVVWYFEYDMAGSNHLGDLQYIEKTETILISLSKGLNMADIPAEEAIEIDLEGNIIWKSKETLFVKGEAGSWHHIYNLLPDDTIVYLTLEFSNALISDTIVNIDRDYNELWKWRYLDHLEPPFCSGSEWCDWTHSNFVTMLKDEGVVYLNSRNLSSFFKIDMESGNILWTFGKDGDFALSSDVEHPWFEYAHAPKITGDRVLFYDNGSFERGYSRVIEYKLDFEEKRAEISFTYDGSNDGNKWFTEFWGDADNLPNGNIFVTAGTHDLSEDSRLFEITREGEKVWELLMAKEETWMYILYNSQKFTPPLKKIE